MAGLVGLVLCVITPLLPVQQHTAQLNWPQLSGATDTANLTAPLVSQSPQELHATVPCRAIADLREGGTVLSTVSGNADAGSGLGMKVVVANKTATVTFRNTVVAAAPVNKLNGCTTLRLWSTMKDVGASFDGLGIDGTSKTEDRPVVAGVYTNLTPDQVRSAGAGLKLNATVDTRFDLSPSPLKLAAIVIGLLAVLASAVALFLLDHGFGYHRRVGLFGWRSLVRPRPVDAAVIGGLILWDLLGGGTSDDGYILTMGKVADKAGYLPDYYRFFGAPEAPFDWYYSLLGHWSSISSVGVWTRIPSVVAGIVTWLLLSRVILPRLGSGVRRFPLAIWAAGVMLLAFWFPMNSGLRSEPMIVLGTVVTWAAIERTIATHRALPAMIATLAAGMTFALAPHGIIAAALLVASAAPVLKVLITRRREAGVAALLLPVLAAAAVWVPIAFRDQSLASVAEAIRIRVEVGPASAWTQEYLRYYFLTVTTTDGSLVRRVPVYLLVVCLFVATFVMLRAKRIPRIDPGPVWRMIGAVFIGAALMSLTPTKWTIQFGGYAGFAAALAAVATVGVVEAARHSIRNFTFFLCGILFALAAAFAGYNNWIWPYAWGVPWFDRRPQLHAITFSNVLLVLAGLAGAVAAWQHFRIDFRQRGHGGLADEAVVDAADADLAGRSSADQKLARRGRRRLQLASLPLTVVLGLLVVGEGLIFVKAGVSNHNTFSVMDSNLAALRGDRCGMASKVLVETDPSDDLLQPADGHPAAQALTGEGTHGFTPDGVSSSLKPQPSGAAPGQINVASPVMIPFASAATTAGTGGGTGPRTINGSTAALPYGLDPARTPVVGSYGENNAPAELFSDWYTLPQRSADAPLVSFSAAGSIASVDATGNSTYGQQVFLEWAHRDATGAVTKQGKTAPIDPGPNMPWRNLRVPMTAIPSDANVVRLHVIDSNLGAQQWVAVTPPRVPRMQTLQQVVGSDDPVLLDLLVGQQFPCQRPAGIAGGVWEVPKWRILPTRKDAIASSRTWQATEAGGPLMLPDTLLKTTTLPTYMMGDLQRDWGDLQRYREASPAPAAHLRVGTATRSGWWRPGPIRAITDQTVYTGH
ncbi:arabinosyltransferase domain-containing protein [Tsukamurella sp. 8F]|uniref:arabinosyltransferase domain-containing protein n=1 Tax=Tsukamurella sp. 8F TaxID=3031961 RepID=UPI0023B91296|nr:arabinosyltransferase domain-containing protein [Tsukamurella sp. 8F]MDF0588860.1 arabinosyltransferase domain-containing protein [Tsukamurella sp. 8F]